MLLAIEIYPACRNKYRMIMLRFIIFSDQDQLFHQLIFARHRPNSHREILVSMHDRDTNFISTIFILII